MTTLLLLTATISAPPAEPVGRMTVEPAAAPKPALKYQLLPEVRELKPGNSTQWYLRCFMEQRTFFFNKEIVAERARQRTMPLKQLPKDQLRNYGGHALTQADYGARLDTVDWQALDRVQSEGTDMRVPELRAFRELGVALQLRFRGEIARGDYDDAIRTAKTMLGFARHLGEYPSLAGARLGQDIAEMALESLTEMVQEPNCPNLYWALTDLPCPIVDLRKGSQGDRVMADTELRTLRDDAVLPDADVDELMSRVSGRIGFAREQVGKPPRNIRAELTARAKDVDAVRAARKRLTDAGLVKADGLSPLHAILLDEKREFELQRDEELKLLGLKHWEIDPKAGATGGGAGEPTGSPPKSAGLFADLLPAVGAARRAAGQLEQRVALLRHVEAIRMYAATHGGKVPGKLAEVEVPLPVDPLTGKVFGYTPEGSAAVLTASGLRVEIAIKK
jgi:hypothetical protein